MISQYPTTGQLAHARHVVTHAAEHTDRACWLAWATLKSAQGHPVRQHRVSMAFDAFGASEVHYTLEPDFPTDGDAA